MNREPQYRRNPQGNAGSPQRNAGRQRTSMYELGRNAARQQSRPASRPARPVQPRPSREEDDFEVRSTGPLRGMYSIGRAEQQRLQRIRRVENRQGAAPSAGARNVREAGRPRTESMSGTRVQAAEGQAYRYGYHSSYRTSDGRIIDGFDASGRPIYRDEGGNRAGSVIVHTSVTPDVRRLHPVRRIRVETREDTVKRPFPWKLVLALAFSTVLVMAVLYTYMILNESTGNLSILNYRLKQLKADYNTLSAELVQREDLVFIDQTASEVLGMVKNDVLTKRFVTIEGEDKTELISKQKTAQETVRSVEINLVTGLPVTEEDSEEQP